MSIILTQYFCPACRWGSSLSHSKQEHPLSVARKINSEHKANAPHCRADVREIQIGDLAPDGDAR